MSDVSEDPNVAKILELQDKLEAGQELTEEEAAFLDQMAADPNYEVEAEEVDEQEQDIDFSE